MDDKLVEGVHEYGRSGSSSGTTRDVAYSETERASERDRDGSRGERARLRPRDQIPQTF